MTGRERVSCSLRHQMPDRIPYSAGFTIPMYERMLAYTGDPDFAAKLGGDLLSAEPSAPWDGHPAGYPDGYVRDPFGVVWNRSGPDKDIGVIEGAVIPDITDPRYTFPEPDEQAIAAAAGDILRDAAGRFTVLSLGFSLFERAWTLCTMPELLMDMIAEPEAVDALLDRILAYNLRVIDLYCRYPVDAVRFGDDWGQQRGLIMGPVHWRRFIKPRLAQMYARVKSHGKFIIQHSCGDIREVLDDVVELGLDCYETFQPEIYDFDWFKRRYGDRLSILGGVSTQACLPCCSPDEVRRQTERLIRVVGESGGLIAGPTHAIPGDCPPENVLAMFDVLREGLPKVVFSGAARLGTN